jgi:cytochrome P450
VHEGYFLPGGTVIAAQAWSAHRRRTTFAHPNVFQPERWLEEIDGKQVVREDADMLATYYPFGWCRLPHYLYFINNGSTGKESGFEAASGAR